MKILCRQNYYATKVVNACIVYELDTWPKYLLGNFTLKIGCLVQLKLQKIPMI